MELLLKRKYLKKDYTIGALYINGEYFCDTLEDTVRPDGIKVYGRTAIPPGTYKVEISYSYRFKRDLPMLLNVPNFIGIRIHPGNTADDSEGCILVGENKTPGKLSNSRRTSDKLNQIINEAKEKTTIKIVYA